MTKNMADDDRIDSPCADETEISQSPPTSTMPQKKQNQSENPREVIVINECRAVSLPDGKEVLLSVGTDGIITDRSDGVITLATPECIVQIAEQDEEMLADAADFDRDLDDDLNDKDRIDCPFCGHMLFPGQKAAAETGWVWDYDVCKHTLFLALDVSAFSGFQYRSKLFNEHLNLTDTDEAEIEIPSDDDPECEEFLSVAEIIEKITHPGLELRSYDEEGAGPCGGTVTFGFVPQETEPAGN